VIRRSATALVLCLGLVGAACGGGTSSAPTPTTKAFRAQPPLPPQINRIPYTVGDLVALRDLQVRVVRIEGSTTGSPGATGNRNVTLVVDLRNGGLRPRAIDPRSLRLYDLGGTSFVPDGGIDPTPLPSGAVRRVSLRYSVPADTTVPVLIVDGRAYPAGSVSSGLIALDPKWRPPAGDS